MSSVRIGALASVRLTDLQTPKAAVCLGPVYKTCHHFTSIMCLSYSRDGRSEICPAALYCSSSQSIVIASTFLPKSFCEKSLLWMSGCFVSRYEWRDNQASIAD